ncbi:MAG: hypothetical protein CMJ84_01870 [Planctomycetes bacterium]|nr:hypothetical protein [Planctomycetota bacterium]
MTMWQTGFSSGQAFCYLDVVEGVGDAEDVVFLIARAGPNQRGGLYRTQLAPAASASTATWQHKCWKGATGDFWQVDAAGNLSSLDPGWLTLWKGDVLFDPVVAPSDPNRMLLGFQGRLHNSADGGHHWEQCYTTVSDGLAATRGYDELVTQGLDYLSDGRVVLANADLGTLVSEDSRFESFQWFYPLVDRDTTPSSDVAYNREAASVIVRPDWLGSGEDGLFVLCSDITHHGAPSKIMRAKPGESDNWINVTRNLDTSDKFIPDFCFAGDRDIFAPYLQSNGPWGNGATLAGTGMLHGRCLAPDSWTWETVDAGLELGTSGYNALGLRTLFHEPSGRVFMASALRPTPAGDGPGGIFMLDSVDDDTWALVFGLTGDWRNFQSLVQATDGSRLYAGTRGPQGMGDGGVLRCLDPMNAPGQWEVIANGTQSSFGQAIPFYATGWDPLEASRRLTDVQALAVSPSNPDVVYASLHSNRFQPAAGLWAFNLRGLERWTYLAHGSPLESIGLQALKFNPLEPDQLGLGTAGMQFWTLTVPGLSPRDPR